MEIAVAKQRIIVLKNQILASDAKIKSWEKKTDSFGAISKVTSFLSRPKDDDFELLYHEFRYQPFWHVVSNAKYTYNRTNTYQVAVSGKEVVNVTLHNTDYQETNGHIHIPVLEHCVQEEKAEVIVDGVTGKQNEKLAKYIKLPSEVAKETPEKLTPQGTIFVPPQTRVSALVRDLLSKMIKGIQADSILEEHVEVECVDLYYHPIFAFQYQWKSKGKEAIVEVDGMTGEVSSGNRIFREYFGKVLDRDFLFDIGADAVGIFIPGGSIAVKAAKRYIDTKK